MRNPGHLALRRIGRFALKQFIGHFRHAQIRLEFDAECAWAWQAKGALGLMQYNHYRAVS